MKTFSLFFFLVSSTFMAAAVVNTQKETNMTVYLHDYSSGGPNSTALPLVGFPGNLWAYTQFGTVFVFDDLITEGPNLTSSVVGRNQGIYVVSSLDALRAYTSLSFVFSNHAYNGSTIQIQGNINQYDIVTEYGVISGTGKFRYAVGYVTFEIISYDAATFYTVFRANLTIRH